MPESDVSLPVFFLKANGKLVFWKGTLRRRLLAAGLSEALGEEYITSMRIIIGGSMSTGRNVDEVNIERLHDLAKRSLNKSSKLLLRTRDGRQ